MRTPLVVTVVFLAQLGKALASSPGGTIPTGTGWDSDDFLFIERSLDAPAGVVVLDQNLVVRGYLDAAFVGASQVAFLPDGTAVAISHEDCDHAQVGGRFRTYSPSGSMLAERAPTTLGCPDLLAVTSGSVYVSSGLELDGIRQFALDGSLVRTLDPGGEAGMMAILPDGRLFVNRLNGSIPTLPPTIDVYDLATGGLVSTFVVGEGQTRFCAMSYSKSTGTLLIGDDHRIYERSPNGGWIRTFTLPTHPSSYIPFTGVARGPNGDVVGISASNLKLAARWSATGQFLGETSLPSQGSIQSLVWAGDAVPSHLPPILSGADSVSCALPGSPISFQETALDPEGTTVTLSASALPSGASFPTVSGTGSVTGTFTWTPSFAQVGSYTIPFTASDSGAPALDATRNVVINVVASSPITAHPQPASICAGGTATFTTQATATAFQWQFSPDGTAWFDVSGAVSSSWTTPPFYESGYVRCIVAAACGPAVTNAARLAITPPPGSPVNSLRATEPSGSAVSLAWSPAANASSYKVFRCDASSGPCTPSLLGSVGTTATTDGSAAAPSFWYRISAVNGCGETP